MFIFTQFLIKFTGYLHFYYAEKSGGGEGVSIERYILPLDSAKQISERVWERKICWEENSWETGFACKSSQVKKLGLSSSLVRCSKPGSANIFFQF